MYEVWFMGAVGEDGHGCEVFTAEKKTDCNKYIRQAVKKGAKEEHFIIKKVKKA